MKLRHIINTISDGEVVTVADYRDGEIYADREPVESLWCSKLLDALEDSRVHRVEVGKCYHDLIIQIDTDKFTN